jgi:hypothetical protein
MSIKCLPFKHIQLFMHPVSIPQYYRRHFGDDGGDCDFLDFRGGLPLGELDLERLPFFAVTYVLPSTPANQE